MFISDWHTGNLFSIWKLSSTAKGLYGEGQVSKITLIPAWDFVRESFQCLYRAH